MIVLPRGITGFRLHKEVLPCINEREFCAYCHAVAQQLRGKVIVHEPAAGQYARNFSVTTIQLSRESIAVLLNAYCPIIAMAHPIAENEMTINFVDVPPLADEFRKFDCYNILSSSDLTRPITNETLSDLSHAELTQIKYWNPSTVGEVIFNFWD